MLVTLLMVIWSVQASMSMYDVDMPTGNSARDKQMLRDVFDVIYPYIMSPEEMMEVEQDGDQVKNHWLETFTNSQKVMISTTLNGEANQYFPFSTVFCHVKAIFHPSIMAPLGDLGLDSRSCIGKL